MTSNAVAIDAAAARYSTVAIVLHWLIAALVLFEVGLGLRMEAAHGSAKFVVFQLHKSVGITILLLMLLRLVWRFRHKPGDVTARGWERVLAHVVHATFYVILFALPISGWVIVSTSRIVVPTLLYGAIPWPHVPGFAAMAAAAKESWHTAAEFVHVNLVTVIYAVFALHVAGALKHQVFDRDGGIVRMAPGARPGSRADPRLILILILILILAGVVLAAGLGRQWLPIGSTRQADARVPASPPPMPAPVPAPVSAMPAGPAPTPSAAAPDAPTMIDDTAPANGSAAAVQDVASWAILRTSTLRFRTSWSGDPIDGAFTRFDGDIDFSPDQLDRSRVEIRVDTGSAVSGDGQRDETLKSPDWFSVASHATATFKADRFRRTGPDRYIAGGTLRLKGVTLPISLPFTLRINGDKAIMQGSATVDRTAYRIGEGEFASTAEIPAVVKIDIAVQATRKP